MNDEVTNGPGESKDDLRAALESAFSADFRASEAPGREEFAAPPETTSAGLAARAHPRGDRGRFAAAADSAPMSESPSPRTRGPAGPAGEPSQQPSAVPKAAPPPGWSIQSKADFDALPAHVRDDIAKREEEVSRGFAKLARYKGLDPWVEMAKSAGRTLPEMVETYVAAEKLLGEDFGSGVLSLCRMFNADPVKLGQFLSGARQPGPRAGVDQRPAAPEVAGQAGIAPVLDRLNSVDRRLMQWERQMAERESRQAEAELARFAADPAHKFFNDVRQTMGELHRINPKMALEDAYQQACWMNPEIRRLLISEQVEKDRQEGARKADQARRASGSLPNGSPVPGAVPGDGPAPTLRAELERQFAAARI